MNCKHCGVEITSDMVYCPNCGEKLFTNVIDIVEEKVEEVNESGPWKSFAMTGHVLGIISLCIFWMMGLGIFIGTLGIVFSSLGKKSTIRHAMATSAFKRSLLATILGLVFATLVSVVGPLIEYLLG